MYHCLYTNISVYTIEVKPSSYHKLEGKENQALVQVISEVVCTLHVLSTYCVQCIKFKYLILDKQWKTTIYMYLQSILMCTCINRLLVIFRQSKVLLNAE